MIAAHTDACDRLFPPINFFYSESGCQKATNDAFKKFRGSSLSLDWIKPHRSKKNFIDTVHSAVVIIAE
jgi:hypothetical protein